MKVGMSLASFHEVDGGREAARRMIERAKAAWAAGLDSLFVGDHHAVSSPYLQNSPILGRLLAEWGGRPAGALYLLPLWHPVLLAEQVGTLASIAAGPFILQCAIGPADRQFAALGVDPRHRPSRFEQSLDILRRLWAGQEVTSDGRYRFERARISPTPPEPIAVWIGASAAAAIDRAARLGDGWIASPHLDLEQAKTLASLYRERCAAHRRPVGAVTIRRDVYVGASAEEAHATTSVLREQGHRGFPEAALVVGSVDEVAGRFSELEAAGYEQVIVRSLVADPESALASIERLGQVRECLL